MEAELNVVEPLVAADQVWFCQNDHTLRSIPPTTPEVGLERVAPKDFDFPSELPDFYFLSNEIQLERASL